MSLNGSGVAVINSAGQPVVATTLITAAAMNALTADLATMISTAIMKDGQQTITANIPFNNKKITGLAAGTSRTDAASLATIQDGTGMYSATVGGTADVITLTPAPAITAYVAGQTFRFIASGPNTTTVTVAISGLAAKAITKNGTTALVANDILANQMVSITYDGTRFILGTHLTADIVTLTGTQVLTNKSLTTAVLTTSTVAADPTTALGVASMQYADKTVAGYNGTANLAAGVGFAYLSGASFVLTLPLVANSANREVTIQHLGTSLSQVYTIKANVSDNISAIDGLANTYLLYTTGEEITLKCNGALWLVHSHRTVTEWVDAGAMTVTATSVNPTKPNTPDIDKVYWRRDGNQVYLRYIFQSSSNAGGATGTGNYLFALPTNIAFDTTVLTPVASAISTALRSEAASSYLKGFGIAQLDSTSYSECAFFAYSTTQFIAYRGNTLYDPVGSTSADFASSEMSYTFELQGRAANWRL